jgi:DNA-binding IscR family transcriptional regulator
VGEVLRSIESPQRGPSRSRPKAETLFTGMWRQVNGAISKVVDKTAFAGLLRGWTEKQNRHVLNWEV